MGLDKNMGVLHHTKLRHRGASAEGAECGGIWGGPFPLQLTRGSGERRKLPLAKRTLAYFEGHITFFATICRWFGFVKQCFMSHLGASPRFGEGQLPPPNAEPPLAINQAKNANLILYMR